MTAPADGTDGTRPTRPTGAARRVAAAAGFVAVAGNVAGVVFLRDIPSAYRLARLDEWASEVQRHPQATVASALAFTLGLVALAGWAVHLGREIGTPLARAACALVAVTALFNAAGTTTPVVHAFHVGAAGEGGAAAGRALLGLSLTLDALFNLGLGLGLLLAAAAARGGGWTRGLMALAGTASIPVAGQAVTDGAADLLLVAAPLWLALILVTSFAWTRGDARRAT